MISSKVKIIVPVFLTCGLSFLIRESLRADATGPRRWPTSSFVPLNVKISISSRRKFIFVGEPLPIDISIINHEKGGLIYTNSWDRGFAPYDFKVTDSKGVVFPFTNLGRKYEVIKAQKYVDPGSGDGAINSIVSNGEELDQRILISRYVDFSSVDAPDDSISKINIEIQRYGKKSNVLTLKLINRPFDLEDPDMQEALKTGNFMAEDVK